MHITVLTNLYGLERLRTEACGLTLIRYPAGRPGLLAATGTLLRSLRADYVLINCSPRDLLLACAFRTVIPFGRCRLISLDTVLPVPRQTSLGSRARLLLKKALFRQVHLFIEYFRETEGYERHYGIPRHRFRYVPFKINRYETILRTPTHDDGYIFCGGNTRRDFRTLIDAVRELPWPVKIVTMSDAVGRANGSSLDERNLPPNVDIVRHDGSASFVDYIAGARLVALPIVRENISASGIGVYLASMALGKCVVISEGPAVNGIVPEGAAIIIPPEDSAELRKAIRRAYTDDVYRREIAEAGRRYALSLEGEDRLYASVLKVLVKDQEVP
jgi:glycosyltransferase involved in cell wall biosynthesis